MDLEGIINKLLASSNSADNRALTAIAKAEALLQQAYEGRYFFELIQNVRDANKQGGQDGYIYIDLADQNLTIANTGTEFNEAGIEGITTIGESTKDSQDYIGFKGIGFKSIQEITEFPTIITRYGSVFFDRDTTLQKYSHRGLIRRKIPLFYFPHFDEERLDDKDLAAKIVTKIRMRLKPGVTEENIIRDFSIIQPRQLVLLGHIRSLIFTTPTVTVSYTIERRPAKHQLIVKKNDQIAAAFKFYTHPTGVVIPTEIIDKLEDKEQEIFSQDPKVDITVVLQQNEFNQTIAIPDAELYVFYPLKITSGFRFLIHAYFLVNPERTALRKSPFNDFLLTEIGRFIAQNVLTRLKERKSNTNSIICFRRYKDSGLDCLYNSLVFELRKLKFIFDAQTKKYYYPDEVVIADISMKGLFTDGRLANKQIIYTSDQKVISWLIDEFQVRRLTNNEIANEIEAECSRQRKAQNLHFFQNLYNYAAQHSDLNLLGKKVLLTDEFRLVTSDSDILYGGDRRIIVKLPGVLSKYIHFIHRQIKLTDFREGRSRTGITEYNTYELTRRLLRLLDNSDIPKNEILNTLFSLQLDNKSEQEIKEKILLPVKGKTKWLSPISNPIYFDTPDLRRLYPTGNFVNDTLLMLAPNKTEADRNAFLCLCHVWSIPAVYVKQDWSRIPTQDQRNEKIRSISGLTSSPYYLKNDRMLDLPGEFDSWTTTAIIENWSYYEHYINASFLPKLEYSSYQSSSRPVYDLHTTIELSSVTAVLRRDPWLAIEGNTFQVTEVIAVSPADFSQPHNRVMKNYLQLLPLEYFAHRSLIERLQMIHLDTKNITSFGTLLKTLHKKYALLNVEKDFIDFFNRILGKLVESFFSSNQPDNFSILASEKFLTVDDITHQLGWTKAANAFYIDDKPGYNILPIELKQIVQPHFTNRDKNTFGKLASRIGKRFSNALSKRILTCIIHKPHPAGRR